MYVHCKNYSKGKTTHERFSKRAAQALAQEEEPTNIVGEDIENDATAELLKKVQNKKQRTCCQNFKSMMYTKERPT